MFYLSSLTYMLLRVGNYGTAKTSRRQSQQFLTKCQTIYIINNRLIRVIWQVLEQLSIIVVLSIVLMRQVQTRLQSITNCRF